MRRKTRPIKQITNIASACAVMVAAAAGFPAAKAQEPAVSDVRNDDEAPLSARERMERRRQGNPVTEPTPAPAIPTPPPTPVAPPATSPPTAPPVTKSPAPTPTPAPAIPTPPPVKPVEATPPAPTPAPVKPAPTPPPAPVAPTADKPVEKRVPSVAPVTTPKPVDAPPAFVPATNQQVVREETIEERISNPTVRSSPSGRSGKSVRHLSNVTRHYSSSSKAAKESIFDGKTSTSMASRFEGFDINVTLRASSEVTYDDNVFLTETNKIDSFVFVESLGINIALGDYETREGNYLAIDYAPAYVFYSADELKDEQAFAHQLVLEAQVVTGRWTFGAQAGMSRREGSSADSGAVEANGRVDLTQFSAAVSGKYDYSERTALVFSADYVDRDYERQLDYSQWSATAGFATAILPKVQVGLTGTYGQVDAQDRGNEDFQQILVTGNYQLSGRVSLIGRAGVDLRQTENVSDRSEFIFGLTAQNEIRDGTIIALEGHRNIEPSAVLPGQNAILTGFSLGVSQRLFERFSLGVKGGFDHVTYQAAGATESVSRDYDYFFVRPSISYTGRWFDVELFYLFRDLESDDGGLGFDNNQVGLKVGVTF